MEYDARPPDRSPTSDPPAATGAPTSVWTAEFEASSGGTDGPASAPAPTTSRIDGSVSVTAQSTPNDVTALPAAPAHAFTVEDEGSASGDRERDTQFLGYVLNCMGTRMRYAPPRSSTGVAGSCYGATSRPSPAPAGRTR